MIKRSLAILFALLCLGVTLQAQNIDQDRGVDPRVDYKELTRFGPWDDRNYQLTKDDLQKLSAKEEERSGRIPAFFRVELRDRFPNWNWDGDFEYPRAINQYFDYLYGGLMVDGVIEGDNRAAAGIPIPVEGEIQLNQVLGANEVTVEINHVDPQKVIAGSNNNGGQEMYYSLDGGVTWNISGVLPNTCCDPTVGWSSDGTIAYAAALSGPIGVNFYISNDFGQTWGPAQVLTPSGSDKEWLHVDISNSSPHKDNVYLTWHNGNIMQFARTRDMGATFDPFTAFSAAPRGIGSDITTDSAGNIYYFYGAFSTSQIIMLKSTDGGDSFEAPFVVAPTNGAFDWPIPAMESRNAWIYVATDADRSGGPFDGSIYAAWTDTIDPETGSAASNHTHIRVAYSRDGGATWNLSTPHATDDGDTVDRFNQWMTVDTNGTVHVVYYDTRHSANRTGVDLYYTFSTDGAVTWNEPARISSETSANLTDGQEWGDYNGVSVMFEKIIATWTDNRDGPPNQKDVYAGSATNVTAAPTFLLGGNNLSQVICAPGDLDDVTLDIGSIQSFTNPVTLSFTSLPTGFSGNFSVNPVPPPGQSVVTLSVDGTVAAGSYDVVITGTAAGADDRQVTVEVLVQDDVFASPTLTAPPNGDPNGGVGFVSFAWDAVADAVGYRIQTSLTNDFAAPIHNEVVNENGFTGSGFMQGNTYFWRVATINACGEGAFGAAFSFVANAERVFLVDQDNNAPDVIGFYTSALDDLAVSYKIFDTTAEGRTPTFADMAGHPMVFWFSGDLANGPQDPEAAELSTYIDNGGKLFLSSEDYMWPYRPNVPPFASNYMGVGAVNNDGGDYTSLDPVPGGIFDGIGNMTLTLPAGLSDFYDLITPNGNGEQALIGNNGNGAAVSTDNTVFFAFPFAAIANNASRSTQGNDVIAAIIDHLSNGDICAGSTLAVDAGDTQSFCDFFELNAMASGGAGGYTYSWSPAGPLNDPTSATPTGSVDETTVFTVMVTDTDGCTTTDTVTVEPIYFYEANLLELWNETSGFTPALDTNSDGVIDMLDFTQYVTNLDLCAM